MKLENTMRSIGIVLIIAPFYDITQWQWWALVVGSILVTLNA